MIRRMDLFAGVVPFIAVAEAQSFRKAAERLGVSTAAVSKAVARLEADLGVRLLERSSRRVALSPEGEALLGRAREAVALLRAGREAASHGAREPRGDVAVSVPFVLAARVGPALARLTAQHPALRVHLRFSDRIARLVDEQVDVAVRMGELADSSLVARLLLRPRWVTVAAPAYLGRRGAPRRPEELARHELLAFVMPGGQRRAWSFRAAPGADELRELAPAGAFDASYADALVHAAAAGVGVAQVLDFMAADALARGALLEVLAEWAAPGPPVYAVCLAGRQGAPRVRAALGALAEAFRAAPPVLRGA
jgi:DNA-binding transcriptional LysR family regulator